MTTIQERQATLIVSLKMTKPLQANDLQGFEWALQDSNLRLLPCKGSTLNR